MIAPISQLLRLMAVRHYGIIILSALGNILFLEKIAVPQASFLLLSFLAAIRILTKKKMLWKGKWGERKTLTTQKLSQQWNEHWNIQRGIHVLDSSVLCRLQHTQQLVTVSSATMKPAESSSTACLARLLFKKANASWLESLNSVQLHY